MMMRDLQAKAAPCRQKAIEGGSPEDGPLFFLVAVHQELEMKQVSERRLEISAGPACHVGAEAIAEVSRAMDTYAGG